MFVWIVKHVKDSRYIASNATHPHIGTTLAACHAFGSEALAHKAKSRLIVPHQWAVLPMIRNVVTGELSPVPDHMAGGTSA